VVRWVAFNRATVPYLWKPLIEAAEKRPWLAALLHPYCYRGAVFYQFLRGCRDRRQVARPVQERVA
jgi:hypothetical protein